MPLNNNALDNCTFTVVGGGYGSISLCCTQIQYGLDIIAGQDESAALQAFYSHNLQLDTFSVSLIFLTSESRHAFYNWMLGYAGLAYQPASAYPIRVQGPNSFDFLGIPSTGMSEATATSDVTWEMTINFVGGRRTAGETGSNVKPSYFSPPITPATGFNVDFYPSTTTLSGSGAGAPVTELTSAQIQAAITSHITALNNGTV